MVGEVRASVCVCVCVLARPPTEKNIQLHVSRHINSSLFITKSLEQVLLHFQVMENFKGAKNCNFLSPLLCLFF